MNTKITIKEKITSAMACVELSSKALLLFATMTILLGFTNTLSAKPTNASVYGKVVDRVTGEGLPYVKVTLKGTTTGTMTDDKGKYTLKNVPLGKVIIMAEYIGYELESKKVTIRKGKKIKVNFHLSEKSTELYEVVVTGTKTVKRQTDSPVIVNVVNSKMLKNVQACNLSEGLKFQPGLRVETDCQTCNYTQLRMNGLQGGYSQILINGRPIFSPLTGLYGMEQIPANMIDRIEVVRGGGSSLYGSSAIGGTVNVITKVPKKNSYNLDYNYQNIDGMTNDHTISANSTLISEDRNSGVSFFMNHRERGFYDANNDNFSEIPMIKNTSIGASLFFIPTENQKLEVNISNIHEYRFGGEMLPEKPAYLTQQSEERTHDVWMASADYQINFNDGNSSFISYLAWQNTYRKHYTGTQPDKTDSVEYAEFVANPPYGISKVSTYNIGTQLNHKVTNFLNGKNIFTLGAEYVYDDVLDTIPTYNYITDQVTTDLGAFVQSDWEIIPNLTLLSGVRFDKHNLIKNKIMISPRASLMYKYKGNTQFRLSYGTGFRAPQAFDTDLHIAFAGGGVSRITLSPDLKPEKSQSWSASINYDKPMEHFIGGFTVEGFYNELTDVFYQAPNGSDKHGDLFEKRNGDGAKILGTTLELRANYDRIVQLECGLTLQSSKYNHPVKIDDDLTVETREFMRAPNHYGFAVLTLNPNKKFNATLNYVYTGSMKMPHIGGEGTGHPKTTFFTSTPFSEFSTKLGYTFEIDKIDSGIELYGGVKNIFNDYQQAFDIGKNRDSNFTYGPAQPRTFYIGIKIKSL